MKRRTLILAGLAGCAGLTRTASALMAGNPPDSPIRRLDPNTASSPWSGVGSITGPAGVFSAVLIHSRFALTAGHVAPADPAAIHFNLNIEDDLSHRIAISRPVHHPGFHGFNPQSPAFDLALLELAEPAPGNARIHPVLAVPPPPGTEIELVGYGASGPGAVGVTVPANAALKRVGTNRVDRLVGSEGGVPLVYLFSFDAPASGVRVKSASTGNDRETGLASGDSGSPAFVRVRGQPHLAGINTFSARLPGQTGAQFTFGSQGGGQVLAAHLDWIRSVISGVPRSETSSRPRKPGA